MLRSRLARIIAIITILFGGIGITALVGVSPALADTGTQLCDQIVSGSGYCLNAWNAGPLVKAYTHNVTNNNFQWSGSGSSVVIEDMNTGTYIGDYQNNSGDAKAGLNGYGAWGSFFTEYSCGEGGVSFHNNHWNAWLSFSDSDGSQVYLNTGNGSCLYETSFTF